LQFKNLKEAIAMGESFFRNVQKIHDGMIRSTLGRFFDKMGISPNWISVIRIILIPFIFAAWVLDNFVGALVLFGAAAWCDALDGAHARTSIRYTTSGTGKILDPLADKLLILGSLYTVGLGYLGWRICNTIAVLEASIALVAMWCMHQKTIPKQDQENLIQAKPQGKTKMVLEVAGLALLFIYDAFGEKFAKPLQKFFEATLDIHNLDLVLLAQLLMCMAAVYAVFSLREHILQFVAFKNTQGNPALK